MNISGIRTHAGFYDYNEIKNGQVRSQQMEQLEPEAEKTLQQTVEVQPESKQAEQTFFSHVGSSSASRAICAPRAFPTLRWDQNRSGRQAVQEGLA